MRLVLLRAIKDVQEGRDPPHVIRRQEEQERLRDIGVFNERLAGTTWDEFRHQRGAERASRSLPV
jgi:hypothetical protein